MINKDTPYLDKWIPERIDVHITDTITGNVFESFSEMPFIEWIPAKETVITQ